MVKRVKNRLVLRFPADRVNEPITYVLIKEYDVSINILNADITHGKEGNLLIEMRGEAAKMDEAMEYLKDRQVHILPVGKTILFNDKDCIHCGACASVCFPDALSMKDSNRKLKFSPDRCVACELCIKACPLQLFELNFGA